MIKWGLIQKEKDPITKIKTENVVYTRAKEDNFLSRLFESKTYLTFYILFTIYALFGDDFRQLAIPTRFDNIFYFLMGLTCLFFIIDIVLGSVYSKLYRNSVLFYMDIISVCFLLFDIGPINKLFFNKMSLNVYGVLARGARAVLIGFPIYKKMKNFKGIFRGGISKNAFNRLQLNNFEQRDNQQTRRKAYRFSTSNIEFDAQRDFFDINDNFLKKQQNQQIEEQVANTGHQLTRSYEMKIILGMFILMYLLPIFWTYTYFNQLTPYNIGIMHITNYLEKFGMDNNFDLLWQRYVNLSKKASQTYEFLKLELLLKDSQGNFEIIKQEGVLETLKKIEEEYRYYELRIFTNKEQQNVLVGHYYVRAVWQIRKKVNLDSVLSIFRTIFFLMIIITLGMLMTKDIDVYFTEPFYKLVSKVKILKENPLDAWDLIQKEEKDKTDSKGKFSSKKYSEIDQLRKSLVNCSKLLQIGLGEAGTKIVNQNLKLGSNFQVSDDSIKNELKAEKVYSIFGFVYINQFLEQAELLENYVCQFVNNIANIVHENSQNLDGKVNKNIGEAFLIVWKFKKDQKYLQSIDEGFSNQEIPNYVQDLAQKSILSFIKIAIQFSLFPPQNQYEDQLENYKGKRSLSLGLHYGWAIEGAIGSKHKIDVSYLSPNVNLASRVTAVCSQYNVPLLISNEVIRFISPYLKQQMRRVDKVFLKGSKKGILLYTYDMDLSTQCLNKIKTLKVLNLDQNDMDSFLQSNMTIQLRSKFVAPQFFSKWDKGFDYYQIGSWNLAYQLFEECLNIIKDDGPALNLIKYIDKNNRRKPEQWNGTRKLLEKQLIKKFKFLAVVYKIIVLYIQLLNNFYINQTESFLLNRSLQYQQAWS